MSVPSPSAVSGASGAGGASGAPAASASSAASDPSLSPKASATTSTLPHLSLHRHVAVAASFADLIATIPLPYRDVLHAHLVPKYRLARKHASVRRQRSAYQSDLERGACPSVIAAALQLPQLPFSPAFLTAPEYAVGSAALQTHLKAARHTFLRAAIALKSDELACLSERLRPESEVWNRLVTHIAASLARSAGGSLLEDIHGRIVLTGVSTAMRDEFAAVLGACPFYTRRLLSIARHAPSRGVTFASPATSGSSTSGSSSTYSLPYSRQSSLGGLPFPCFGPLMPWLV
ncbi:hypothetical protein Purlil1_13482 [Purpureocillium lilacinum]|uniref:Uncharacterized protein n=1 Tax=Purpureocillium lilacinum TaxID=33203 RepID=A0ABR0BDZ3_PURLI|nr:hypothetical protein Purlil1_13482 [Purpureocillium lilacinum]